MSDKPKKTDIDYERGALLLKVQSMAAAAGPALVALLGEATAELATMAEAAGENLKVRAEEAKAKAEKMEAEAKAKAEVEAAKVEPASTTTYTSDNPSMVDRKY